ncbi:ABC transporter permease [Pendulispora brunnea]|uniref:ABC transporter permease n=1 Tax=Pendulispora brunnea TaxID=2905690 RepID=A0ABZ2KJ27_9BACT
MLGYHLKMVVRSLRRSPGYALLVMAGVALGVAVATMFSTVRHTYAKDPVPSKSSVLYYVRLNSWDPVVPHEDGIPPMITYMDAMAIVKSNIPVRQSPMLPSELIVSRDDDRSHPKRESARLCFGDFFAMFNVPFKYGAAWDRKADDGLEPVVVLNQEINERLFGGSNSVGKHLFIEGRTFRVVGVLDRWSPTIRAYDLTVVDKATAPPESIYMPFHFLRPMQLRSSGAYHGWKVEPAPGYEGVLASETCWFQMWVELATKKDVDSYKRFLDDYAMGQRKVGRFLARMDNRVTPLLHWMMERQGIPPETDAMTLVAVLFFVVCSMNLMGVLMAKFLARAPQLGVQRALGASKRDIFFQLVLECEIIALAGGIVGVVLAALALIGVNHYAEDIFYRNDLFQIDWSMLWFAIISSLVAGLIAGVYPAYRICRVPPSAYLRLQ